MKKIFYSILLIVYSLIIKGQDSTFARVVDVKFTIDTVSSDGNNIVSTIEVNGTQNIKSIVIKAYDNADNLIYTESYEVLKIQNSSFYYFKDSKKQKYTILNNKVKVFNVINQSILPKKIILIYTSLENVVNQTTYNHN